MKIAAIILSISPLMSGVAFAQSVPVPTVAAGYSVSQTDLGTLLDDPKAKAILMKYIPDVIGNDQIAMARGMTLKSLQNYAGDAVTDAKLAAIQTDLSALKK